MILPAQLYNPWQPLQPNDVIDAISPAAKSSKEQVEKVRELLNSWNLIPRIQSDIFGDDLLCSNSDEKRFLHLKNALLNPESKAIWCLSGGYGCARLIPELEKLKKPTHTKLLIGFSDVTALHLFLQQRWGWRTLHGPGARQVALELIKSDHIQEIKNIIFGKQTTIDFQLEPLNKAATHDINVNSTITGGTLSLVQTSIGTNWQPDIKNKILFLEDVNERGYKVDRMLQHLKQTGIFAETQAVILGDFVGGDEPSGNSLVEKVLERFAGENAFPVLRCHEIGHGKFNRPLPFGTPANLKLGSSGLLSIQIN